jgi:hypothetical protein
MILVKAFRKVDNPRLSGIIEVYVKIYISDDLSGKFIEANLFCEVVIAKNSKDIWIKIPQRQDKLQQKYVNLLYLINNTSDIFQQEIKKQLEENFPQALNIPSIVERRKKFRNIKKSFPPRKESPKPRDRPEKKVFNKHVELELTKKTTNFGQFVDPPPRTKPTQHKFNKPR